MRACETCRASEKRDGAHDSQYLFGGARKEFAWPTRPPATHEEADGRARGLDQRLDGGDLLLEVRKLPEGGGDLGVALRALAALGVRQLLQVVNRLRGGRHAHHVRRARLDTEG